MRLSVFALSTLAALSIAGCNKKDACSSYVDAVAECYGATDSDAPEGYDLATACPNGGTLSDAYYACIADAYTAGDCASQDGLKAIATAIAACKP
jgi:hypothetical protein